MKKSKWHESTRGKCAKKILLVMRLCCFLILAFTFQVAAESVAQNVVKAKFKNSTLGEVLKELKEQTGVYFMYNTRDVNARTKVNASFDDVSLEEALKIIFKDLPYAYSRVNDYFLIIPKSTVAADSTAGVKIVKGVVRDVKKLPLPGVTVMIKGTKLGTVSDAKGKFELKLPEMKNVILIFSFIGMETLELKADTAEMNVTMKEAVSEIDEVVVTGYQQIERRMLTSSVLSVKGEDLLGNGAISLDQMLQGRLAGVMVMQATSTPGAAPKIRIRGSSSITGSREPVWVVDGVILEDPVPIPAEELNSLDKINLIGNAISFLNPEDIERVDILKDASATAIYGVKAANGVIVVTTKKGKVGDTRVSYTLGMSVTTPPNNKNMHRMNSAERIEVSEEMHEKGLEYDGFKPSNVAYEGAVMDLWDKKITYDEFLDRVKAMKEMNTDWYDLLFQTSFSHHHSISVSGGSERTSYYFSGGFADDQSVTRHESLRRYNGMAKINTKFGKTLDLAFNISGSWTKTERPHSSIDLYDYAYNTSRAIPAYAADGSLFYYAESNGYKTTLPFNIFNELKHSGSEVDNTALNASLTLDWKVFKWLTYNMMFSFSRNDNNQSYWADEQSYYISKLRNVPYGETLPDPKQDTYFAQNYCSLPYGGELKTTDTRNTSYTWRNSIALSHVFKDRHGVSANIGMEVRSSKYDGLQSVQYGYLPGRGKKFVSISFKDWVRHGELVAANPDVVTDTETNFLAFYGTFSYGFDNRYIANFNIRTDGSNKFGQDKRFLPVWSVSGRWNVHNEHFMPENKWLDELAIRASYGVQGNVHPDQTPDLIVNLGSLDSKAQEYSSTLAKFPNTRLKWEKTSSFNLGIDFSLYRGFLSGTFEVYKKKGKDMVVSQVVAPATGAEQVSINDGTLDNKGWELAINLTPIQRKDWTWGITFNTSKNYNKVKKSGETSAYTWEDYVNGTIVVDGKAVNSFYSYKFNTLDGRGLPTFLDVNEKDDEGNMLVHSQQEAFNRAFEYSGQREPDFSGGGSMYLRYKALSLSCQFVLNLGNKMRLNDMYESTGQKLPFPQQNMSDEYVNRWRKPGDENITNIPVLSEENLLISERDYTYPIASNGWEMYNKSNIRVVSGNFLRCRALSLRYNLAPELCKKLYMRSASISFDAGNLFVIKSKDLKGRDPEQTELGSHTIPPQRSYSVRLNVTF